MKYNLRLWLKEQDQNKIKETIIVFHFHVKKLSLKFTFMYDLVYIILGFYILYFIFYCILVF